MPGGKSGSEPLAIYPESPNKLVKLPERRAQRTEGHFNRLLGVEMDRREFLIREISSVNAGVHLSERDGEIKHHTYYVTNLIQALFVMDNKFCNAQSRICGHLHRTQVAIGKAEHPKF